MSFNVWGTLPHMISLIALSLSSKTCFINKLHSKSVLSNSWGTVYSSVRDFYSLPPPYNHDLCCIELIDNPMG